MRFYSKQVNGILTKLLVQQISDTPPTDCIEITEDDFRSLSVTQTLEDMRLSSCSMIDQKAGEVRLRFITFVPGQSETYLMKAEDAKAVAALNYQVDINDYPMVKAEMDATGLQDIATVCNGILHTLAQWRDVAAVIESKRRGGKINVGIANSSEELQSYLTSTLDELDAIQAV